MHIESALFNFIALIRRKYISKKRTIIIHVLSPSNTYKLRYTHTHTNTNIF